MTWHDAGKARNGGQSPVRVKSICVVRAALLFLAVCWVSRGASLRATISDKADSPIKDATIVVFSTERYWQVTSPDGRFSIDDLPAGTYSVEVLSPGFHRYVLEDIQFSNQGRVLEVTMNICNNSCGEGCRLEDITYKTQERGQRLIGVVYSSPGKPLEGATVAVTSRVDGHATSVLTNNQGEFGMDSIPPGRYAIVVRAEGYLESVIADLRIMSRRTTVVQTTIQPRGTKSACQ